MNNLTKYSKSTKKVLSIGLFTLLFMDALPVYASSFIDDSSVTGNIFSWNRHRERLNVETNKYEDNLIHSTFNANIDAKSGYLGDIFALELGAYGAWHAYQGAGTINEIAFANSHNPYPKKWENEDISGASFYKAQIDLKFKDFAWLRAGYIQPSGNTLLAPQWSFLPGTYRGGEVGTAFDFDNYGAISASYMIADQYKSPWYRDMYDIRWNDNTTKIDFVHSAGFKYDSKNNFELEAAVGQAYNYMNQYFSKVSYHHNILSNPLSVSYQFYGAQDQDHLGDKFYDGLAWLQAATLKYQIGPVELRTEGVIVKAEGKNGYFLQRMTPGSDTSNGRLDIWWNSRSDFNANGEKAVFGEISYDLGHLSNALKGLRAAASYAYGWDAKPNSTEANQSKRVIESAWNVDLGYAVQTGPMKNTSLQLHYTNYTNHSDNPSWGGGYSNMFQDEHDIKFIVSVPFTVFSPAQ